MQSLKNASQIRRSGRLATGSRGSTFENEEFYIAPDPRRKAGDPNSYAASEGASADQGDARFAELDGEALAQAIDDQVEQAVASSPVVVSLSLAVDCSTQAISSLQAVQASFREASLHSPSPSDSSHSSIENAAEGTVPNQPSPAVVQRLKDLESQLTELTQKHEHAVQALAAAEREARQEARATISHTLKPLSKDSLPNGTIRRWLVATSREDHLATLGRNTRPDGSPLLQRVGLSTPPWRPQGPLDAFVQRLSTSAHALQQQDNFKASRTAALASHVHHASPRRPVAHKSLEQRHRRFYSKSERRAIDTADEVGAERASQESHDDVDANGYEFDGFRGSDEDDGPLFSSDDDSTDDDTCTTLSDAGNSDEDDAEMERRSNIIMRLYQEQKKASSAEGLFPATASGAALVALRKDDIVVKRPTSRTHIVETILTNWLRCDLSKVRVPAISELLRQLQLLPREYAISVYYALAKRIRPVCRSFFKFLFYCIEAYLPHHVKAFGTAYRRVKKKTEKKAPSKSVKPITRAPSIRDIADIDDATSRFYDEYRHYQRDHKGYTHKTVFECLSPSQASSFASQCRKAEEDLAGMDVESFMDVWRSHFGLRSSGAALAALKRVRFKGDIAAPAAWSSYHQRFVSVLHQAPTTKRPPPAFVAEIFMENCGNTFIEDDVMAYEPANHQVALQFVLDRLNDSGFVTSDGFRNSSSARDDRRNPRQGENFRSGDAMIPRDRDVRRHDSERHRPREADRPYRHSDTRHHDRERDRQHDRDHDRQQHHERSRDGDKPRRDNAPAPVCSRCKRSGHTIDSCICKHDKDGQRLPEAEPAVYAERKKNAVALATSRINAVHAIREEEHSAQHSSDTSDIDIEEAAVADSSDGAYALLFTSDDEDAYDGFDCCLAAAHAVTAVNVPAPSLLDCGDVESNPGPLPPTYIVSSSASSLLRDYFSTPRQPCGQAQAHTLPIVAAMPRPLPDSSDDESPVVLPLRPTHQRNVASVPHGMPELISDSESSDSDDDQPPSRTTTAARAAHMVPPGMPELISDSESSDSDDDQPPARVPTPRSPRTPVISTDDDAHIAAFLDAIDSSNSDTSDVEAEARALLQPAICSTRPVEDALLPPPRFIGFVTSPSSTGPPPENQAIICAVDTMCQGSHSIISEKLVNDFQLPTRPFAKTCRTANGARVTCTHVADFHLVVRIRDAWASFPVSALVWADAAEPLLLHNKLALETGLTDFCAPNDIRVGMFGRTAFTTNWKHDIDTAEARALAIYHDDFMAEEFDDFVDLSAPLRCGDQDISLLPSSAMVFAKRFPQMSKAIPRDAHPGLEKWRANIRESAIPLYAWPPTDLKDLKEERLPFKVVPKLHAEFDKLISMHYAEPLSVCPTVVAMKAQLIQKTKNEFRFCVNGSQQKKVMEVGTYPMPHIRQILDFVSAFPFRAKIDMKHGYHNFEVHPDDIKWTTTIGGGRAIAWRKLVQGFASSGAFFQFAVCKLLGERVWRICAVYLDDIIIVGRTLEECNAHVLEIMTLFDRYRFRINFAKCVFTPSPDIDFLGCSLRGSVVLPGPKVSTMLSKIRPPHEQVTPKGQRHHLHVFLGCCAFIMQHAPGLKQTLAPLYIAVASEPYTYGERERLAFQQAMATLDNLQPYHLPSCDPDSVLEVFTDASGGTGPSDPGAWAAALGQRKGAFDVNNLCDGWELLQVDGGVFNFRQAEWNILKKEGMALFQALTRFRPFILGRRIRIFVDSKVLLHMFRSECPVLKRWFAYVQGFDYELFHIASQNNGLVDCLSRYVVPPAVRTFPTPKLLKAVRSVPAPSILRCGDVESNPGPPKLNSMPGLISDSDSDSDSPSSHERTPASRKLVITVSSDSPPIVAPVVQSSRRVAARAGSTPPQLSSPLLNRQQLGVEDDIVDTDATHAHPPSAHASAEPAVRFSDSSSPSLAPAPSVVRLARFHTDSGPYSFIVSFAEALRHEQDRCPHARGLAIPFDALDVRSQVMWFLQSSSRIPMSLLFGRSFQQAFAAEPQPLHFHLRDDTRVPESWHEYCTLMADPDTMPDLLFLKAACVTYSVQMIIITETDDMLHICPGNAFRRIFLFCNERIHWSWGAILSEAEADAPDSQALTFRFSAPALHSNAFDGPRPSLSNTLDISDEKLQWIHAAHNAYSGHPGVQATVRLLIRRGHQWRRMTAHVAQFIKRCPTCTSSRLHLHHTPPSAGSIRLHARPLRRWHIDQSGSMGPCAFTGYTLMIVFICEVTQFTVMFGSRHGTALETAIALVQLMGWLGLPESVHSDGGSENDNYIRHQVQHITGIKHTLSQPGVPSSDGIAERNIQTAKRFVRLLTVDMDRHNAWGLLLPIAQKGVNDLPREQLLWMSPNDIVFASLADSSSFAIPTFYSRALNESDLADANAYHISANFAHRVSCFQQLICNSVHELQERALTRSAARNPTVCTDVYVGQCVLIDWNAGSPPTATHPRKRGPYKVIAVHHNSLSLEHLSFPPPADQDRTVEWSKHAHVYQYDEDAIPVRSRIDPAASQVPAGVQTRNIDCVVSHTPLPSRVGDAELPLNHVARQLYQCRMYASESTRLPPRNPPPPVRFSYAEIAHTHAFDVYVQGQRQLSGHTPVAFMPDNWSPHAVPSSQRPAHPAAPLHEHSFGVNDDEGQHSQ